MTGTATDAFPVFGTTAVLVVTDEAALADARPIADAELAHRGRAPRDRSGGASVLKQRTRWRIGAELPGARPDYHR